MLISLRNDHKEHLQLLTTLSEQVVGDFCKLASDFLKNGPNPKLYNSAANKLEVELDTIQNCIYGLINLLLEACKNKLSGADFRDTLLTLGFSYELESILSKFYNEKQEDIHKMLTNGLNEPHYHDLQWRLEIQLASRSLLHQVTPLITLDLTTKMQNDDSEPKLTHNLVQTDPTNLVHLANELENALIESRSQHSRKIQRTLNNMCQ